MGAMLHYLVLDYLRDLEGVLIEIGSNNGENSTDFYAGLVYNLDKFKFYTIDIDNQVFSRSHLLAKKIPNMEAFLMPGEIFLKEVFPTKNEKICYAYLDNYDWNGYENLPRDQWPDWMIDIEKKYNQHGFELTQEKSAAVHLEQTKLIEQYAATRCIIQFDDTYGDFQTFTGKGMTAVPYLKSKGWKILVCRDGAVVMSNY